MDVLLAVIAEILLDEPRDRHDLKRWDDYTSWSLYSCAVYIKAKW